MMWRRTILKAMLGLLALAALLGATAVILDSGEIIGRLAGTSILTAAGIALLLPTFKLLDHRLLVPVAIITIGIILVDYIAGLGLIWEEVVWNAGWRLESSMVGTIFATLLVGIPAAIAANLMRRPWGIISGVCTCGLLYLSMLFFLGFIWVDYFALTANDRRILMMGFVCLYGTPVAGITTLGTRSNPRTARVIPGLICTGIALLICWGMVILDNSNSPAFKLLTDVLSVVAPAAGIIAYANVLYISPLMPQHAWLRKSSLAVACATGLCISIFVIGNLMEAAELSRNAPLIARFIAAGSIVSGCAILAVIILGQITRIRFLAPKTVTSSAREIDLTCPRCGEAQRIPVESGTCLSCGLRISVNIEEPCCPQCGYNLYQLDGEHCPECNCNVRRKSVEREGKQATKEA